MSLAIDIILVVIFASFVLTAVKKGFILSLLEFAAVILASILLIVYIGLRFKKIGGISAGVCGIIALLHDVMIIFAVM